MLKAFLWICALMLFAAVAKLPMAYYTLLRIVVTFGAVAVIIAEYRRGPKAWMIVFGMIALLFNPLFPVYLYRKTPWLPFDIACGLIFLGKALIPERKSKQAA